MIPLRIIWNASRRAAASIVDDVLVLRPIHRAVVAELATVRAALLRTQEELNAAHAQTTLAERERDGLRGHIADMKNMHLRDVDALWKALGNASTCPESFFNVRDAADNLRARCLRLNDECARLQAAAQTAIDRSNELSEQVADRDRIIAGRNEPPLDEEIRAHANRSWLVDGVVWDVWFDGDHELRVRSRRYGSPIEKSGYEARSMLRGKRLWIPLGADHRPCAWPVVEPAKAGTT